MVNVANRLAGHLGREGSPLASTQVTEAQVQQKGQHMSSGMQADTAQLVVEAGNFDRISGELTGILGNVEGTATALSANMRGGASGPAVQAALLRFSEAARQQIDLLTQISENVHSSGIDYDVRDDDIAQGLAAQMSRDL